MSCQWCWRAGALAVIHNSRRWSPDLIIDGREYLPDAGVDVQAFLDNGFTNRQVLDIPAGVAQKTLSNYANHLARTPVLNISAEPRWTSLACHGRIPFVWRGLRAK